MCLCARAHTHAPACVSVCALYHNDLLSVRVSKCVMVYLCGCWQFTAKKLSHAMITSLYGWHFTTKCQRHFSEREIVSSVTRMQSGSYSQLECRLYLFLSVSLCVFPCFPSLCTFFTILHFFLSVSISLFTPTFLPNLLL